MRDPNPSFGRRLKAAEAPIQPLGATWRMPAVLGLGVAVALGVTLAQWARTPPPVVPRPASAPVDETVVPPDLTPLRAFPDTTVIYYDVPGTDTRSIHDYMRAHGSPDSHDQTIGEGWTRWHMKWHYPVSAAGCDTAAVQVSFSAEVTLPRFVDFERMDQAHQAGWDRYLNALIVHESGHIRHAYQHVADIAATIRGRNCGDANTAGQTAVDTLGQYDAAYDQETHHGSSQGVRYPEG